MAISPGVKRATILGTLATAATAVWAFSGRVHDVVARHVDRYFFSTAEAQTLLSEVKQAAETAKKAADIASDTADQLLRYMQRQELKEERALLDRLRGELADTELWESQNGANALSRARKADLIGRIDATLARIRCLENPNVVGC